MQLKAKMKSNVFIIYFHQFHSREKPISGWKV